MILRVGLVLSCLIFGSFSVHAADQFVDGHAINDFYAVREGRSFWTTSRGLNYNGRILFARLENSWTHGLNPQTYHLGSIQSLLNQVDAENRNRLEHLLTDAFIRYGRDLTGMRVNASGLYTQAASWRQSLTPGALVQLLQDRGNVNRVLNQLEPQSQTYKTLQNELAFLYRTDDIEPNNKNAQISQIIANMERLRWVNLDKTPRHIVVNIAAATLWAMDNGQVVHEMPVVVGRKTRPTYSFVTKVKGVRLNPTWTVPVTIKREDILPKAQADPSYFQNKGMEVISYENGVAQTVDPTAIDWAGMTPDVFMGYTLVQTPGGHNPLGDMRVLMYNTYDIYLHGTNRQDQFNLDKRTLSSGCVRVEKSSDIADFILGSPDRREAVKTQRTKDLMIDEDLGIYLYYFTVWLDKNGGVVYGDDIYGLDKKLLEKLENIDGVPPSVHNDAMFVDVRH